MNTDAYIEKINALQASLLAYQAANGRHYGDLSRAEQSVEDLIQALYMRSEQLKQSLARGGVPSALNETPSQRVTSKLLSTAVKLSRCGHVDPSTRDLFEESLDAFDIAADLKRQAESVRDCAETSAIRAKRVRS